MKQPPMKKILLQSNNFCKEKKIWLIFLKEYIKEQIRILLWKVNTQMGNLINGFIVEIKNFTNKRYF